MPSTGKNIILAGIAIVIIGLLIYFWGDKLSWFGHLPGDIRIENDNTRFYFPFTSMILISLILNGLIWVYKYFFK